MAKDDPKNQLAYLYDMLEAGKLIHGYVKGVSREKFLGNNEKRDAVAMRITVLGESAAKIDASTEKELPQIDFKSMKGMRNRIAHGYGAVDFNIVWQVTQTDIVPLIKALDSYLKAKS